MINSEEIESFIIGEKEQGLRLDQFCSQHIPSISRSRLQQMIMDGKILLNDHIVNKSLRLKLGDHVKISSAFIKKLTDVNLEPLNIPLTILYEDEYIAAIDKPAGMVVHPGNGNVTGTIVNALLSSFSSLSKGSELHRPGIVHRLDKETSGVLLVAKTDQAHSLLSSAFANRKINKEYLGICIGTPQAEHGDITSSLDRSKSDPTKRRVSETGKSAHTEYFVLESKKGISVIKFLPHTGRTHQIRVHCSTKGFPIMADSLYGGGRESLMRINPMDRPFAYSIFKCFNRHALHAYSISFTHPITDMTISIQSPLPEDFRASFALLGILSKFEPNR